MRVYMKWKYNINNDEEIWEETFDSFKTFAIFMMNNNQNITILELEIE